MSDQFKVGDKVRVVSVDAGDTVYFGVGAEGTVVRLVGCGLCVVRFTSGEYCMKGGGIWYCEVAQLEKITPYSATFTEPKPAEAPQGHTADGGGLQKHSVGGLYPLAVVGYSRIVGYGRDDQRYRWVVENLETGKVACFRDGSVRQWENAAGACSFAEQAANGGLMDTLGNRIVWLPGRPYFPISTELQLNTARS